MGSKEFLEKSKQVVVDYFNSHADKTDQKQITGDDVFVVWYCKTLQNHKALLSTNVSDGMYYEITITVTSRKPMWTLTKNGRILW